MNMLIAVLAAVALVTCFLVLLRINRRQDSGELARLLEEKHRAMIADLHGGLDRHADRLSSVQAENAERLRAVVSTELNQTRDSVQSLTLSLQAKLDEMRLLVISSLHETLTGQAKHNQDLLQGLMQQTTAQLTSSIESLTKIVETRLLEINGKVTERLDEGFKKTNETFANVMARLATIDEAQRKIDGLTTNVVSLQELLGDKRSRGAFGEVQLDNLVRNILPPQSYMMQHTLPNGSRVDCALFLPPPTGTVAVDSKFPMENYHRMFEPDSSDAERVIAQRQFKIDVKHHIDDIGNKYIIPDVTSDGAVMFVPAEAVFAEIHGHHGDVVEYAMRKRVWIVSPTTLMAILNTARAVIKDVETRRQVHIIKENLGQLGKEFMRFDKRMKNLSDHIRQAHEDAEQVQITSQKISNRFAKIEAVELKPDENLERLPGVENDEEDN
ncbi:MAG TPA: DNA recombination protein RmuC [Burkholderiales bacterium]|nr:DNA recombination protein RmuC [Burkholderiales bacterium]